MAKTGFATVDDYIASQPEEARDTLGRVRGAIRQALPKAVEKISYNIPAYKLRDTTVLYFAGWRRHYSLYPAGARLIAAFQKELAGYEVEKNTIRFPLSEPVPVKLIARIAKFRAREAARRE